MARYLLAYLCLIALTLSTPSRADDGSCIIFKGYYAPFATYKYFKTSDNTQCCRECSEDSACVAWTRDAHGRCFLKNNVQYLVAINGVDSGIKFDGEPSLVDNRVGASVLSLRARNPEPVSSGGMMASASVSISSRGSGSGSSTVTASSRHGVSSFSRVSGDAVVRTSASTPSVSLATHLSKEDGKKKAQIAIHYYKNPVILGQVVIVNGVRIPIISTGDGKIHCYTCKEFSCPYNPGYSYSKGGHILQEFDAASHGDCCRACRANPECVTWYRIAKSKRCVLNRNLPARSAIKSHASGVYI